MNANLPSSLPIRRVVRVLLIILWICLAPFAILALVATTYLTLDSDTAALRRQIMAATAPGWSTKVQLSVGQATIGAVNLGLGLVGDDNIEDARLALSGVKRASVGIYERSSALGEWAGEKFIAKADRAMEKRGWTRLIGVVSGKDTVLVYAPLRTNGEKSLEVCLAVINDKQLIVASAKLNTPVIEEMIKIHSSEDMKTRWLPKGYLVRN